MTDHLRPPGGEQYDDSRYEAYGLTADHVCRMWARYVDQTHSPPPEIAKLIIGVTADAWAAVQRHGNSIVVRPGDDINAALRASNVVNAAGGTYKLSPGPFDTVRDKLVGLTIGTCSCGMKKTHDYTQHEERCTYRVAQEALRALDAALTTQAPAEPHPCEEAAREGLVDELEGMRLAFDPASDWHDITGRAINWIKGELAAVVPSDEQIERLRAVLAPFVRDENYIENRFGVIDDDDDAVASASSFEQAIELWREWSAKEPKEEFRITGWNHAVLVYGRDVERLFGPLKGTFECPICGEAKPHEHSGAEVADQRRHEQWMQKNNAEKRQEILRRAANVDTRYGQRPKLDAAVAAVLALSPPAVPIHDPAAKLGSCLDLRSPLLSQSSTKVQTEPGLSSSVLVPSDEQIIAWAYRRNGATYLSLVDPRPIPNTDVAPVEWCRPLVFASPPAVLVEPAPAIDPKLPAAASILVATLGKVRNKCRPGYVVSKFAADWISEATAIATAINASLAAPAVPLSPTTKGTP